MTGRSSPIDALVSVVVPVYNGGSGVVRLLAALERQTVPRSSFEVVVVDDGSDDGTAEVLAAAPGVRALSAPERRGSYAARNIGVRAARAPVLAFTDADCEPADDWIERGLAALEDEEVDLIAGEIEVALPEPPTLTALLDASRFLDQRKYVGLGFGATANLWVRAGVFERVGAFNDRVISGGDTEFGQRATAGGARLVYAADVRVSHAARGSARALARKSYRLGFGAAQHKYHVDGPLRDRPRVWLHPGAYLPKGPLKGIERLHARGIHPTNSQLLGMRAIQYASIKLPNAFGNLAGTIYEERRR